MFTAFCFGAAHAVCVVGMKIVCVLLAELNDTLD